MSAEGGKSAFLFTPFVRSWSPTGAGSEAAEFAVFTGADEDAEDDDPVSPADTEPETVVGDAAAAVVVLPFAGSDCDAVATAVLCCSVAKAVLDG